MVTCNLNEATRLARLDPPTGKVSMVLDTDTYNEIDDQFAVVHALLSPDQLGPEKQKTLVERMRSTLKKASKDHPVLQGLLNTVTSPFIIIGLLVSSRFPILPAGTITKVRKSLATKAPGQGSAGGLDTLSL